MPSFGAKLKLEREKRAITLEQISTSTKIGTRMLRALEDENFDQLPGGIFNKGFVRAYARHVGLDEDQAVADYLEASGQNVPLKPDAAIEPVDVPDTGEPAPPWRTPLGWVAAGLLVIALMLTLWSRRQHNKDPHPQSAPPAPSAAPASNSAVDTSFKSASTAAPSSLSPTSTAPSVPRTSSPAPAPTSTSAISLSPAASAGEFTVVILAREDSWVLIQADDNPAAEDTLIAETQRAIHARKQVSIKVGNAGGLDFVFNGKKLTSQGDYGEVKTITFGPAGLQPKAPAPAGAR